jgi:hypothetical protein
VAVSLVTHSGKHATPAASPAFQLQLSPDSSHGVTGLWQLPPAGQRPDDDAAPMAAPKVGGDGGDGMASFVAGLVQQADGKASLAVWQVGSITATTARLSDIHPLGSASIRPNRCPVFFRHDTEPQIVVQVADMSPDARAAKPVATLPVGFGCGLGGPESGMPVCAAQLDGSLLLAGPCGEGSSICVMAITAASGKEIMSANHLWPTTSHHS